MFENIRTTNRERGERISLKIGWFVWPRKLEVFGRWPQFPIHWNPVSLFPRSSQYEITLSYLLWKHSKSSHSNSREFQTQKRSHTLGTENEVWLREFQTFSRTKKLGWPRMRERETQEEIRRIEQSAESSIQASVNLHSGQCKKVYPLTHHWGHPRRGQETNKKTRISLNRCWEVRKSFNKSKPTGTEDKWRGQNKENKFILNTQGTTSKQASKRNTAQKRIC